MEKIKDIIKCQEYSSYSKRTKDFLLEKYVFNYKNSDFDKNLLDNIIKQGKELSEKVNQGAASNSVSLRSRNTVKNNAIAGLLAEFVWKDFLSNNNIKVEETEFKSASNQIDLRINANNKTIEVRSSFPRNGIKFAICHSKYQFDIIGPYSNSYKPNEIQKNYYTRVLFPFQNSLLLEKLKSENFEVYLTGGATWEMMCNDKVAINKSFIPEDELNIERISTKTNYRVIPFSNALDTYEIMRVILKDIK